MTVLTMSIFLFQSLLTMARANAHVWIWVSASVRARAIRALSVRAGANRARYAPCRKASLFLHHHDCFEPISLFLSLLTQARANAYVWVWGSASVLTRAICALSASAGAIRARYAPCRTASLFLLHHDCFDPVHFTFPKFTNTSAR
jgi:hypothetical protein